MTDAQKIEVLRKALERAEFHLQQAARLVREQFVARGIETEAAMCRAALDATKE